MKTAAKIYTRDFSLAMILYVVSLLGANYYLAGAGAGLSQMVQAFIALIPMVPVALAARAVIVFSRSWDELQRKQALEGMLVAFFVVGMGTFLYGFLEGVGFPKLDVIWVFPALIMVQGVAQLIVRSRY